jgi:nitroreductase
MDGKNYAMVDGTLAMDHMTLCATDLGLGTCWVAAFNPERLREVLGIPANIEPLAMTPIGRPASPPKPKQRKAIEEIVHRDRW